VCGTGGQGEAKNYLGTEDVTTDGAGAASFSMNVSSSLGNILSALATPTDPSTGPSGELSLCRTAA
jgi:hypothetical protein